MGLSHEATQWWQHSPRWLLGGHGLRFQLDFELDVIHQSTFEIQDLWGRPVGLGWFGGERGMMGRGVWILWMGQVGFVIYTNVLFSSLAAHRQEHKVTQPFPIIGRDGSPYNPGPDLAAKPWAFQNILKKWLKWSFKHTKFPDSLQKSNLFQTNTLNPTAPQKQGFH